MSFSAMCSNLYDYNWLPVSQHCNISHIYTYSYTYTNTIKTTNKYLYCCFIHWKWLMDDIICKIIKTRSLTRVTELFSYAVHMWNCELHAKQKLKFYLHRKTNSNVLHYLRQFFDTETISNYIRIILNYYIFIKTSILTESHYYNCRLL